MSHLNLIFLVLALVLFLLAAFNVSYPRVSFGWLGLACLTIAVWFHV